MINELKLSQYDAKQILTRIKDIISVFCGTDIRNIRLRDSFYGDLGLDSLDVIDLSTSIEDEFHIYLPEDLSNIKNVKMLTSECIRLLNLRRF